MMNDDLDREVFATMVQKENDALCADRQRLINAAESIKEERDDLLCEKGMLRTLNNNQAVTISDLTCQLERLQAEAAAMAQFIRNISESIKKELQDDGFCRLVADQKTIELAEEALSTTAGQALLDRLQRAEAVLEAAQEIKDTAYRNQNYSLYQLQEAVERAFYKNIIPALAAPPQPKSCEGNGCCSRCGEQPQQNVLDMGGPGYPDGY